MLCFVLGPRLRRSQDMEQCWSMASASDKNMSCHEVIWAFTRIGDPIWTPQIVASPYHKHPSKVPPPPPPPPPPEYRKPPSNPSPFSRPGLGLRVSWRNCCSQRCCKAAETKLSKLSKLSKLLVLGGRGCKQRLGTRACPLGSHRRCRALRPERYPESLQSRARFSTSFHGLACLIVISSCLVSSSPLQLLYRLHRLYRAVAGAPAAGGWGIGAPRRRSTRPADRRVLGGPSLRLGPGHPGPHCHPDPLKRLVRDETSGCC